MEADWSQFRASSGDVGKQWMERLIPAHRLIFFEVFVCFSDSFLYLCKVNIERWVIE